MTLETLSVVRLLTDRYRREGVAAGAVGVVLDVYDDGYEVEFSMPDGTTIAWFAVEPGEVEPYSADASVEARRAD
ncbi:MAG: DUF4926 domain-containing protein [Chloroflexota bacterium]|nr:DUF4926 domain-containing protein [Chloroflexota bacterium]